MFTPITNHIAQAQARLMSQYTNSVSINNFLTAIVTPIQDIEYALGEMNTERSLTTAFGQQLDNLGTLIGIARLPGQTDSQYLADLYGQIAINASDGQASVILQVFLIFSGASDAILAEYFPGECLIASTFVFDPTIRSQTIQILKRTVGVGINFGGIITYPSTNFFGWSECPTLGVSGWGTLSDPTVGGVFSSIAIS